MTPREILQKLYARGDRILPSKGEAIELRGVLIEIAEPRARLSRTESRGKPFSCLGELCWYLSGTNHIGPISYYLPSYEESAEGCRVYGGYGPRLMNWERHNQIAAITTLLRRKRDSRQAVIQLFDRKDLRRAHRDIPCTCTIQCLVRSDRLEMITYMRSNDIYLGLPHDVFCFTMMQEVIARDLSVELGSYKHVVGSLHSYIRNEKDLSAYLDEGVQSTVAMPAMPAGSPWPSIRRLLDAERWIRTGRKGKVDQLADLHPYWADLVRLLKFYRLFRDRNIEGARLLSGEFGSAVYRPFMQTKIDELERQVSMGPNIVEKEVVD